MAEEEIGFTARAFSAYGPPLEMVTSFKYLGWVILATDNDWPEVVRNLERAKKLWRRMLHILSKEGATHWVSGLFFKGLKQAVLILVGETWVFTPRMGKALGFFHTHVERRRTGKLPYITTHRTW